MFLYQCSLLSIKLRLIVMSTNVWNIEKEKDTEKEKVGRQASETQREKELQRERKNNRRHFLLE